MKIRIFILILLNLIIISSISVAQTTQSNGRYIIHSTDQRVFILDTETGEVWRYIGMNFQRVNYLKEFPGGVSIVANTPDKFNILEREYLQREKNR